MNSFYGARVWQCIKERRHTGWFSVESSSSLSTDLKLNIKAKKGGGPREMGLNKCATGRD